MSETQPVPVPPESMWCRNLRGQLGRGCGAAGVTWRRRAAQAPLPLVTTSHGPITRRRLDAEYETQTLRSRLPARESW